MVLVIMSCGPIFGSSWLPAEHSAHAPGGVLHLSLGHMDVTLSHPNVGVAEHFLDHREGHPLADEERGGRMPEGVQPALGQPRGGEDLPPLAPVAPRVDRLAVPLAEDEIVLFPLLISGEPLENLPVAMRPEQSRKLGVEPDGLLPLLLDLPEDQAAILTVLAVAGVPPAIGGAWRGTGAGVMPASLRARLRLTELRSAFMFGRGDCPADLIVGRARAPHPLADGIAASMLPGEPLKLEPDVQLPGIEVQVLPSH